MEAHTNDNKIIESNDEPQVLEFEYNFVNTPWDDRSNRSKFGIIILLLSIFVTTMALVVNNFIMHYKGFRSIKSYNDTSPGCHSLIKIDNEVPYVARIYTVSSKILVCLGAVVSPSSVLANGVVIKFRPLKMYLGSVTDPQCKKGFPVDVFDSVPHDGFLSSKLVLLSSYEILDMCSKPIPLGNKLNLDSKVTIIGRPTTPTTRYLTQRYATLAKPDDWTLGSNKVEKKVVICLKDSDICPVRAGDLMIQNGKLFGLATSSINRNKMKKVACFADLRIVVFQLRELDDEIIYL